MVWLKKVLIRTKLFYLGLSFLLATVCQAQDSIYTRSVLKTLCSAKMYGRGYLKGGLAQAEQFLVKEIKSTGALPLFAEKYTQEFTHTVNTFPSSITLIVNDKTLRPGIDFIPGANNGSLKGHFRLKQKDSITYVSEATNSPLVLKFKEKLTYSVGRDVRKEILFEIDKNKFSETPVNAEIKIKNKFVPAFKSKNVACYINGTSPTDSLVVFTAHYDHLGGIGNSCYFPGANDNASGVSMLLNLMRHYKIHAPKYRTVFVLFAGEEAGLLGSQYFVESKTLELTKIKFLINLDLLGTGDDGIMVVNGSVFSKQFETLENINRHHLFVSQIKKRGKAANSDHYWFSEKGVPCFFIYTMGGITAYHDVKDVESTLPLTKYREVFQLLLVFASQL